MNISLYTTFWEDGEMTLLQRLRNDAWELLVMFAGWVIFFLTNIPINFLTIIVVTIMGYLLGELIRMFIWQNKKVPK
jgi:hypothetical protein